MADCWGQATISNTVPIVDVRTTRIITYSMVLANKSHILGGGNGMNGMSCGTTVTGRLRANAR